MERRQRRGLRCQNLHCDFVLLQHHVISARGGGTDNEYEQNEASASRPSHGGSSEGLQTMEGRSGAYPSYLTDESGKRVTYASPHYGSVEGRNNRQTSRGHFC